MWVSSNSPISASRASWAWRYGAQAIACLALGPDRGGEIAAGEGNGLAAANDLDRTFELASGKEPRQPRHRIQMRVGQQHVIELTEAELGSHKLALDPFDKCCKFVLFAQLRSSR